MWFIVLCSVRLLQQARPTPNHCLPIDWLMTTICGGP
jgi:hypothetical protein